VDLLGRLNPFRVRIGPGCTRCGACTPACRYQALEPAHLAAGRPGLTCALCGECLPRCPGRHLGYHLPGLSPERARRAFLALIVALYAAFLGLGRA
jgi:NAD-dependent dihydropyrimidine dehydrogenase PreA subunit